MLQACTSSARRSTMVLMVGSLVLSVLTFGNLPQAQAQAEPTCAVGQLDGNRCVEEADPLAQTLVCPTSDTVFAEGSECFTRVDKVGGDTCPDGTTVDPSGDFCQAPVEPVLTTSLDSCPDGFSPDPSLGGICARFEQASQGDPSCPVGTRGEPGDCYILLARLPVTPTCDVGVLTNNICILIGPPAANGPSTCPAITDGDQCYRLVPKESDDPTCLSPYTLFTDTCRLSNEALLPEPEFECPESPNGERVFENEIFLNDRRIITDCTYVPLVMERCPADSTPVGPDCRVAVDKIPGPLVCPAGFTVAANRQCFQAFSPVIAAPQCPPNSVEDSNGDCRLAVPTAEGPFFCEDPDAALNGRSCVFTTGFVAGEPVLICAPTGLPVVGDDVCFQQAAFLEAVCPAGTVMAAGEPDCRKPEDLVLSGQPCPAGFELADTRCLRFSTPDNNLEVSQDEGFDALITEVATTIDYLACPGGTASFELLASGVVVDSGPMVEAEPGKYTASYVVETAGNYALAVTVVCPDGETEQAASDLVFIDPSGVITDCVGDPVVGAIVTLTRADTADGPFVPVPDGDASIMDPAINVANPSTTGADGRYRWDVIAGFYQVVVSAEGASAVTSEVLPVPPARTDVDLVLADLNCVITGKVAPDRTPLESPVITTAPATGNETSITAAVASPAPAAPPLALPTTLAVTGTETTSAFYGFGALTAGVALLGIARRRQRQYW